MVVIVLAAALLAVAEGAPVLLGVDHLSTGDGEQFRYNVDGVIRDQTESGIEYLLTLYQSETSEWIRLSRCTAPLCRGLCAQKNFRWGTCQTPPKTNCFCYS